MTQYINHYVSFITRALDFQSRATRSEYWSVIPVIWAIILFALSIDVLQVQQTLVAGEIPILNPFYYPSFIIFIVTLIPRLSLNVRRLHDTNRNCMAVFIPSFTMFCVLVLVSALIGSMMNSSLTGESNSPDDPINIIYPVTLFVQNPAEFWDEMFVIAQVFDSAGMLAADHLVDEIIAQNGQVNVRRRNTDVSIGILGDIFHTISLFIVYILLILAPISGLLTHIRLTMLSPSPRTNRYGPNKNRPVPQKQDDQEINILDRQEIFGR